MVAKNVPSFSLEEVSKHNKKEDCWVVIQDKVYDVTNWLPKHPGGATMILNLAGTDCTEEFNIFHLNPNIKRLGVFFVGYLVAAECKQQSLLSKDVELLVEKLKEKGVFKPDYWFYFRQGFVICLLLAASIFFLAYSTSILHCCISAIFLGFFWQQLAFVGHDLGHHVVTHNKYLDDRIAIFVGNSLQGISLEWWKHNHNTHHSLTNSVNHDPDIQHLPFMAISKEFSKSMFSTYHKRVMKFDGVARWFVSMQHYLFYPIMSLARFNLYAQSFIYNLAGPGETSKKKSIEILSLVFFWLWFSLILVSTGSFSHALAFLFISHATAGIVHVQICISHFSMETFHGIPQSAFESDGYIKSQLTTTMNIECPWYMDLFHGGLQFQIEHHLFPHLTRSKLRYVQTRLKELCHKHDLPYLSKPFLSANYDVLCKLYQTSKELQLSDMFWDGINMNG